MIPIVTINYNGHSDTVELIDSLNKSAESFDLIVVDNNSTNKEELEIIKKELFSLGAKIIKTILAVSDNRISSITTLSLSNSLITLIQANDNYGFATGTNIGLEYALTIHDDDYLCILNNDTIVTKLFLTTIVDVLETEKSIGAAMGTIIHYGYEKQYIWSIGGHISYLKATGVHEKQGLVFDPSKKNKNKYIKRKFVSGCFTVFKREVLIKIGLLDESYFFGTEEFQYSRDISKFSNIAWIPESIIYHKVKLENGHGSSHTIKNIEWQFNSYMNKIIFINKNKGTIYRFFWKIIYKAYIKLIVIKKLRTSNFNNQLIDLFVSSLFSNLDSNSFTKEKFELFKEKAEVIINNEM